ncbi:protein kinase [Rhodococcus sp. D2-41]|uniref:protein kinase domain-containing protein n=1 Tax=Speluncibacter jeojiensis TaxID=2710754 RepID=UPI00241011BE|nr:protein kinase [Rhodococcus sp. D2-41]MDG3009527.1 protein kinase [Rhodococcus sp. D2-41]
MAVRSGMAAELAAAGFSDAVKLGRSGLGAVYRCTQTELGRTVAVKVLTEWDGPNRARFMREWRAMGRLTGHPNIATVLQVGQTESGRPLLVREYYRGGSLEQRIQDDGPLPAAEVSESGAALAGALEAAHQLGVIHRDVTPSNILFTDYGRPALTDFGVAHISGGFRTGAGQVAGSPAYTAPEVLGGDPATAASDVYALGATLFCALAGHAAFERRSGEGVLAQFLRIICEPVPDLRVLGVPDPVCTVIERAMARDPRARPSAAALAAQLQRVHISPGTVDSVGGGAVRGPLTALPAWGALPADRTSFVGRRTELAEVRDALHASRLVTLTGIGGVGKTRLALRAAGAAAQAFPDGVWLAELGALRDPAAVLDLVAAIVGVRDRTSTPLREQLIAAVSRRTGLLVLDNCEQVIDAVAELAGALLRRCPNLQILVTNREALEVTWEAVVPVSPMATPPADGDVSLRSLPRFDAIALFLERAAAVLPGFELTADNSSTITQICGRLEGLPLAIELAAARLRVLSPEQILARVTDLSALATHGGRDVLASQRSLWWSIGWSFDLCTPDDQRVWGQLSLFPGGFDLDAAEHVCGIDTPILLDALASLVDKSILIREETRGEVRFRMLDAVRAYGRGKVARTGAYAELRRRRRDWYTRLALGAEADWVSPRQIDWIARLRQELPNLREAFEDGLTESGEDALAIAAGLGPFWLACGLLEKGRRWLDSALQQRPQRCALSARALYALCVLAAIQGDVVAAQSCVERGRRLDAPVDPASHAFLACAEGFAALYSGDASRAQACLQEAADAAGAHGLPRLQIESTLFLGWACHLRGHHEQALADHKWALALARMRGDYVYRTYALWAGGMDVWGTGERERATQLVKAALRLTRRTGDPLMAFACLQALAWIDADTSPQRAAVIMGAAEARRRQVGSLPAFFPDLAVHQRDFEQIVGRLGPASIDAAHREGQALNADDAIDYALAGPAQW